MRVPKILYHGTTVLRWGFIKREGFCVVTCKSYGAEELLGFNTGFVYLTNELNQDLRQATWYGLNKSLQDMAYLHIPEERLRD
jgi:hypothetical protein